jgi:hypothetical protein
MDGWTLLHDLRESLNERSDSDWLNDHASYLYLYEAAMELNARTASITTYQDITTVADTAEYRLNPDFMGFHMTDREGRYYIRFYDNTSYYFINHKEYDEVVYDNLTDSQDIPNYFSIKPATTQISNVTGTASADGSSSNGEATLTDTSASDQFEDVEVGDLVHNTTDTSHGIVLAITSDTALVTAIFDSNGDAASWEEDDAYVIVPQPRHSIILEPESETAGYTIRVYYIQKPPPVFSPYRSYKFPTDCRRELVQYALGRYKYRDRDPEFGNAFYQFSDRSARVTGGVVGKSRNRGGFKMNLRKR